MPAHRSSGQEEQTQSRLNIDVMKLKCYTADGSQADDKKIAGFPSFEGDAGIDALRQVVIAIQANRRQGNASTKLRSEVRGSGKKIHRQKGLGIGRAGDRAAVQRRGGGVVFGPKPRSYSKKINKKMKRLALARALYDRAEEGKLCLIEEWKVSEPKTKQFVAILDKVTQSSGKVLLVDDAFADNFCLAARNVARSSLGRAQDVSPLDLVGADDVILSSNGLSVLLAKIGGSEESS